MLSKSIKRFTSTLATLTLVLGFVMFAPGAKAAASLALNNEPDTVFNLTTEELIAFHVKINDFEQNTDVNFYIREKGSNVLNFILKFPHNNDAVNLFIWNGQINGVDVEPGTYEAVFKGDGLTDLVREVEVVTAEPILGFGLKPYSQYAIGSGEYEVYTNISGLLQNTTADLYIVRNNPPMLSKVDSHTFTQNNEGHVLTWDGKLNGNDPVAGEYELQVYGEDTDGNKTNILKEPLTIVQATQPILTFVGTPKDEIVAGEDYKVSVKLTGADNIQVSAFINTPKPMSLGRSANLDNGEIYEFVWEGKDLKLLGDYDLSIRGESANNFKTNVLTKEFEVIENDGSCGGYKDMKKTDDGCEAVEWVQSEGIMTGNPDNTFEPHDYFQRDEAAKVSLEAFNLYNANTDYCNGDPFPDVDEDAWHGNYICRGISAGMVTGYKAGPDTGLFKPERSLNLIEMFALILRNVDEKMQYGPSFNKSFSETQWYSGYAAYAYQNGLYPSKAGLVPTQFVTRLEVAEFLYELHKDGKL